MKIIVQALGTAGLFALAACGGGADDQAAANIEATAENQADALEAQADNTANEAQADALEAQADNVEDAGEAAAEKADDNDDASVENRVTNQM